MHESFETFFELHEHAEVYRASDHTLYDIADFILTNDFLLFFLGRALFREDKLSFFGSGTDDGHGEGLPNKLLQLIVDFILVAVFHARIVFTLKLGSRKKALDTLPFENKSALVGIFDRKIKNSLFLDDVFRFAPDEGLARFL